MEYLKRFAWHFKLNSKKSNVEGMVLAIPDLLSCRIRKIGGSPEFKEFELRENYAGRAPGCEYALEAELTLSNPYHAEWKKLAFGVPFSEFSLDSELCIQYTGAHFQFLAAGKAVTEELPFGTPVGELPAVPTALHPAVIYSEWGEPQEWNLAEAEHEFPIHCWSPAGLSAWAGDAAVAFVNGEFHLFYLYDLRHHSSKFGAGGHQWGHLVTKDFRSWRDDGIVIPFMEQWETFGTGTPFELNGKVALAVGYHTRRLIPLEVIDAHPELYLRGGGWAESSDGTHYKTSGKVFTASENPTVYSLENGKFSMYTGNAETVDYLTAEKWPEFKMKKRNIVPAGKDSFMQNCTDCPSCFKWGKYYYLLAGFTGMWRSEAPDFSAAYDLAANGQDIYDGLNVPMVAPFKDGRQILIGWLRVNGWGGVLGAREIVFCDDGVPGLRWIDEAMPEKSCDTKDLSEGERTHCDFYLEADNIPAETDLEVTFSGGEKSVAFKLDSSTARAEIADIEADEILTWREQAASGIEPLAHMAAGRGFAVERLRGIDLPFKVRIMVRYEQKWGGSVIDAEIAGIRTIIWFFKSLKVAKVTSLGGVKWRYTEIVQVK